MGAPRLLGGSKKTKSSYSTAPAQIYRDDPVRDDGESVSAMSLHSNVGQFSDDEHRTEEDLPPYTDSYSDNLSTDPTTSLIAAVRLSDPYVDPAPGFELDSPNIEHIEHRDAKGTRKYILSNKHTTDPAALEWAIRDQLYHPPDSYLWIRGEHTEKRYDNNKKKTESHNVEDFNMKIDLSHTHNNTHTFVEDGSGPIKKWAKLTVTGNATKTYRGGITKSVNKLNRPRPTDVEIQEENEEDHAPSLTEWCHLFCASHYSLKSFELRHEIVGRGDEFLKRKAEEYIRATNYRGRITVSFQTCPRTQTFQMKHKLNVARHNNWIWWLCVLLQLWIITWPILFFTSKRWAVVKISWPFRRRVLVERNHPDYADGRERIVYANKSEEAIMETWRYTLQQAALNKTQSGVVLKHAGNGEEEARALAERQALANDRRNSEPEGGFVGGVLSLARGLGNVARERNDARGWGYDE